MAATLLVSDLLNLNGLQVDDGVRLVRHRDPRYDMDQLLEEGLFETYQSFQRRPVFHGLHHIVSLIGDEGATARLHGIYSVGEAKDAGAIRLPPDFPYAEWQRHSRYYYPLARQTQYANLEDRVLIDWKGRNWVQKVNSKQVIELLPPGKVRQPFRDYLDFVLSYRDLVELYRNPDANREWRLRLSLIAGVYLIVASTTGEQYVGSASGEFGIWGRWRQYAETGHGGNRGLRRLIDSDSRYPAAFRFSILQVLPKSLTPDQALQLEQRFKRKLGRLATSLNAN